MDNCKFKILYVVNADWYFKMHWLERALDLVSRGHEVHVAVPLHDKCLKEKLVSLNINVHSFDMNRTSMSFFNELRTIFSLRRIIKEVNPFIVHSVTIKPNLHMSILSFLYGFNLVTTYAGLGTLISSNSFKYKIARFAVFSIIKLISIRLNSVALFENEDDKNFFERNRIIESGRLVRVFGAGVDIAKYSFTPPKISEVNLEILFASRLLKSKGLDEVVAAVRSLKQDGHIVRLSVAGIIDSHSPLAYSQAELKEFMEDPCINWLGERRDVDELIKDTNIVVLPTSYGEGVPRILIEACSIGRPIITTSLGGCKDICIDEVNGYIVESNNYLDVKRALLNFINSKDNLISFGIEGRKLVERSFSNEKIFNAHYKVYESFEV